MLQKGYVNHAVGFGNAYPLAEIPDGFRSVASSSQACDSRHSRVVPSVHNALVHKGFKVALAHHRVSKVESCELYLLRRILPESDLSQNPVVERSVILKFQGAEGVGYSLYGVLYRVGKIVHRVDAPFVPGVVVRRFVSDSVYYRISHVYVRRCHVYLRSEHSLAVGKLSRLHVLKDLKVLLNALVSARAFLSRLFQGSSVFLYLLRRQAVHVCQAFFDQNDCSLVHLVEVVGRPEKLLPFKAQPSDILFYGAYILYVFLNGVGIVISQVALSVILFGCSEVYAYGLRVTYVKVAVRLRRETGVYFLSLAALKVSVNYAVNKVGRISFAHFILLR